jgi:hypothetical protein
MHHPELRTTYNIPNLYAISKENNIFNETCIASIL